MKGKSTAPKISIINSLLKDFSTEEVVSGMNLPGNGNIERQLDEVNKTTLVEFLFSTEKGKLILNRLEKKYPLPTSPTFYLVIAKNVNSNDEIINKLTNLIQHKYFYEPSSVKSINKVYSIYPPRIIEFDPDFLEIPIFYEKVIDYTSTDIETWGEVKSITDLRKAFIWISSKVDHGLIACSDYSALNPIRNWANNALNIHLEIPNISRNMFEQLAKGAKPRSASFSTSEFSVSQDFDIQSLSVFDTDLDNRKTFQSLHEDIENWDQTSGFFSRHPLIPMGGLGIARKYGKIWTPNYLPIEELLRSAINLLYQTENIREEMLMANDKIYMSYYDPIKIEIDNKKITAEARNVFNEIAWNIIQSLKNKTYEQEISFDLFTKVITLSDSLGMTPAIVTDCPNCGNEIIKCELCSSPLIPSFENEEWIIKCPNHEDEIYSYDRIKCSCGEPLIFSLPANINLFPNLSSITAFRNYINSKTISFSGWFILNGNLIKIINKQSKGIDNLVSLDDLSKWKNQAHINLFSSSDTESQKKIVEILSSLKEKCQINKSHPNHDLCKLCLNKNIDVKKISPTNLCLPRIMGEAINEPFDGIHSGWEGADIKYKDSLVSDNKRIVNIGIHLKSREKNPPKRGVGQASKGIKGLYAQFFFTVYKQINKNSDFDIIGISIPNKIFSETKDSFTTLSRDLGVNLIILDESDWFRIISAAINNNETNRAFAQKS